MNEIEYIPGDLFQNFRNLERIDFSKNKLKVIEPNIFDELEKLKIRLLNFRGNENYEFCFSPNKEYRMTFEDTKNYLVVKYLEYSRNLNFCFIKSVSKRSTV